METKTTSNKLICLLLTIAMMLSFVTVVPTEANAASTTGFHASGTKILDANGNNFIMRGINHGHAWFQGYADRALKGIADTGSNSVRIVCETGKTSSSDLDSVIQKSINNKLIPIVELHDATGSNSESELNNCVNYWVRSDVKAVLAKHEKYVILNIANEWGGSGMSGSTWASAYSSAIKTIRNAGINNMIMVDSPDWGHGGYTGASNCETVFNADPDKNVVFSIHMYEYGGGSKGEVKGQIDAYLSHNVPVVVGEFGQRGSGHTEVDYIMQYCQEKGVGYLAWSWQGNTKGTADEILDMTTNWGLSGLTEAGKKIVNGTNGIKATSKLCSLFTGIGDSGDDSSNGGNDPSADALFTWKSDASTKASAWYSVPDDESGYSFGAALDLTAADKAVFTLRTLTDNEYTNGQFGFGSGADYKWTAMDWDCAEEDPGVIMKEVEPGVYQVTIDGIKAAGGIGDGADCMFKVFGFNRIGTKNDWMETTIDLLSIEVYDANGKSIYKEGDGSVKPVDPSSSKPDSSSSGGDVTTGDPLFTWKSDASTKTSAWYSVPDEESGYAFGATLDLTAADKAVFTLRTLTDNEWTNGQFGFGSGADYKWVAMDWDCSEEDPGVIMKEIEPGVYQVTIDGIKAAGGIGDGADCMFKVFGFNRIGTKNDWMETTIDLMSINVFDAKGNVIYKEGNGSVKPVDPSSSEVESSSKPDDSSSKPVDSSSTGGDVPSGKALFTWTAPASDKSSAWFSVPDAESGYSFGADLDLTKADKAVFTVKSMADNEYTNGQFGFGSGADYKWTAMDWDCQDGDLGDVMKEIDVGVYEITIDGIKAAGGIGDGAECMFKIFGFNRVGVRGDWEKTTIDLMNIKVYDANGNVIYTEGGNVIAPDSSNTESGDDSNVDPLPVTGNSITVWEGNITIPTWKDIPPLSIANCVYAQEGGKLKFTYAATADATTKKLPEVQFTPVVDNNWETMEDHLNDDKDVFSMPLKGTTYTTAPLTAQEAYNLRFSERFMIKGQNCELKKIEYILAPGQTLKSGEEKTLWTGKFSSMAGWSSTEQKLATAVTLNKMNFQENGILRIYYTSDVTSSNPAQVQLVTKIKSSDWDQIKNVSGGKDFSLTVAGTYQDILLTADQAAQLLSAREFWMKANTCEVTKITYRDPNVVPGASGSIGGDDSSVEESSSSPESSEDPTAPKTIDVYEGELELGNWAGYEEGIVFDDLKVGDVIKFTVKDVTSTDPKNPAKVTIQDSEWNDIDCIGYPVVTKAQPYAYVNVTQEVVDALLNKEVILKGCNATLTNVQVLRNQNIDIPSSSEEESSSKDESSSEPDDSSNVSVGDSTVIIGDYPQFDGGTWGTKEYTFTVPTAGKYKLTMEFQGNADAFFKIKLDGVDNNPWMEGNWVGDAFGGNEWSAFGTKEAVVELTAGEHTFTVEGNNYAKYGKLTYAPVIEEHKHSYTSKVTTAATCTENGVRTFTCSCGDSYTEVIKATGHKYVPTVVPPTTTSQGYTEHTCSVCGDSYKDTFTDPIVEEKAPEVKLMLQKSGDGKYSRFILQVKLSDMLKADTASYAITANGKTSTTNITSFYSAYKIGDDMHKAPSGYGYVISEAIYGIKSGDSITVKLSMSNFNAPYTKTITVR